MLLLLVVPVVAKLVLIVALARAFRASLATSLRVGFYLAQAGELALVMLTLAYQNQLIPAELVQPVLAAMIISLCAAPLVIEFAEPIVRRLTANDWLARAAQVTQIAATTMARQDHVIICGYGRSGQNLARLLDAEEIPFIAMDGDPQRVREAAADGSSVVYGDASRREALLSAGLTKARAVAITFANTPVALKIIHHVHRQRPELPVIVRTVDDSEIDKLLEAGATEVVPEVLEGSLMLASHALLVLGIPLNRVLKRIRTIREERYGMFRGFFHGATDMADAADNLQARLRTVVLPDRASAVGQDARRPADRRAGRGHGRAAAGRALAASRPGLALRGRRRRRPARAAGAAGAWPSRGCCTPDRSGPRRVRDPPKGTCDDPGAAPAARCRAVTDRGSLRGCEWCRYNRRPSRDLASRLASTDMPPAAVACCRRSERDRADRRDVRLRPPAAGADRHQPRDSAGPRRRDHGRLGLRQDDDPAAHRRPAEAAGGRRARRRPQRRRHVARRAVPRCGARSACCSSSARSSPT